MPVAHTHTPTSQTDSTPTQFTDRQHTHTLTSQTDSTPTQFTAHTHTVHRQTAHPHSSQTDSTPTQFTDSTPTQFTDRQHTHTVHIQTAHPHSSQHTPTHSLHRQTAVFHMLPDKDLPLTTVSRQTMSRFQCTGQNPEPSRHDDVLLLQPAVYSNAPP